MNNKLFGEISPLLVLLSSLLTSCGFWAQSEQNSMTKEIVFYEGFRCAAEFGCSKQVKMGVITSEPKYRSLSRCVSEDLQKQLNEQAVKDRCNGKPAVFTMTPGWLDNNVDITKDKIAHRMEYRYNWVLEDGTSGSGAWSSSLNAARANVQKVVYNGYYVTPKIVNSESRSRWFKVEKPKPAPISKPQRQIVCSFNGSGYDKPSFGGGGYRKYRKQPFNAHGYENQILSVVKSACNTCAASSVEYGVQVDTCRFKGCFTTTGERLSVSSDIFNVLNEECHQY